MLDVLDKEREKRGHRFVRYADDCNIYVRSQKAGERVLAGIETVPRKAPQAQDQQSQERGRQAERS
jgi:retron-type reverse transcriptase